MRTFLVGIHRYVGLGIAGFLAITGLTGSILAFREPLDRWLNPDLLTVPASLVRPLPAGALVDRITAQLPDAEPRFLPLNVAPGRSLLVPVTVKPGSPSALRYDQAFFDPSTGALLGTRSSERSLWDRRSTIGFLYRLHRELALPARWGVLILAIVSVLWTFDSIVGLLVTLPARAMGPARKSWWQRWGHAWRIKSPASRIRRAFDLHRAGGIWLWLALMVFAWSSVMLSAGPVYRVIMERFVAFDDPRSRIAPANGNRMVFGWTDAIMRGRAVMPVVARRYGFSIQHEGEISRDRRRNTYTYFVRSDLDIRDGGTSTGIIMDAATGKILGVNLPSERGAAGNAITQWLYGIHMAQIFGLPYSIFVSIMGLLVTGLSATGVLVWNNKRRGKRKLRVAALRKMSRWP